MLFCMLKVSEMYILKDFKNASSQNVIILLMPHFSLNYSLIRNCKNPQIKDIAAIYVMLDNLCT